MIRIETSRQTVVTFKTLKAAENRVARDAEWFANAAEEGTVGTVEVSPRWDAAAQRTLYDVQYVVCDVLDEAPEGAQVRVTGPYSGSAAYGYVGTVEARDAHGRVHVRNGNSRWILQANDDVLVEALPEGDLHLEDGSCCDDDDEDALTDEEAAALDAQPVGCECPVGDRSLVEAPTSDSALPPVLCRDCGERVYGLSSDEDVEPTASSSQPTERSSINPLGRTPEQDIAGAQTFGVIPAGYAPLHEGVEPDYCHGHRHHTDAEAIACGRAARLRGEEKATPADVCVEEDEIAWESDPAKAEAAGDRRTAESLRNLLHRMGTGLSVHERDALNHAIYVLEG